MIDIRYYISTLKRYRRYRYFWEYQLLIKYLEEFYLEVMMEYIS